MRTHIRVKQLEVQTLFILLSSYINKKKQSPIKITFSSLSICLKTSQNVSHDVYAIIAVGLLRSLSSWTRSTTEFQKGVWKKPVFFKFPLATLWRAHIRSLNLIFTSVFSNQHICLLESLRKISVQAGKLLSSAPLVFQVCVKLFLWQQHNKKWKPTRNECTDIHKRNFSPRNESRFAVGKNAL